MWIIRKTSYLLLLMVLCLTGLEHGDLHQVTPPSFYSFSSLLQSIFFFFLYVVPYDLFVLLCIKLLYLYRFFLFIKKIFNQYQKWVVISIEHLPLTIIVNFLCWQFKRRNFWMEWKKEFSSWNAGVVCLFTILNKLNKINTREGKKNPHANSQLW